jgi:fibronectin-binding autotransporter adhesin
MGVTIMSKRANQKGMALLFALIFILILSVLGVSIMFASRLEIFSSFSYLQMTQARYGAEAGMNLAANYIANTYCAAGNTTCANGNSPASGDTVSLYNTNVSPVTLVSSGAAVTLSTTTSAATYPVSAVETAFRNAALGSLTSGNATTNYTATATLLTMNQVTTAAGPATVQTWSITANGNINGVRNATEQTTGVVEQQVTFAVTSSPSYAVFATGTGCGSLTMGGSATIESYSSTAPLSGGAVVLGAYAGNIGTNGNLTMTGSATVDGTLSSPRSGVLTAKKASCVPGAVIAEDATLAAGVTGCGVSAPVSPATTCSSTPVQLSQNITSANPVMPTGPASWNTGTAITVGASTTCALLASKISVAGCSGSAGNLTFTPAAAPNATGFPPIVVNGGAKLALTAGTYNIDSITVSNGAGLTVSASTGATTLNTNLINLTGGNSMTLTNANPMTLNVYNGLGSSSGVSFTNGTALSMSGSGTVQMNIDSTVATPFNASGDFHNTNASGVPTPAMFQINYAGTGPITLEGGATSAAVLYAPNAPVSLAGGAAWYGSIVGSTISDTNGVNIYYDRTLAGTSGGGVVATVQPFMMDSFSWTRF